VEVTGEFQVPYPLGNIPQYLLYGMLGGLQSPCGWYGKEKYPLHVPRFKALFLHHSVHSLFTVQNELSTTALSGTGKYRLKWGGAQVEGPDSHDHPSKLTADINKEKWEDT
jgi:hypothetical protein